MSLLTSEEINNWMKELSGWQFHNNEIGKEFQFKDFPEALSFVNKVGEFAEEMNHHPDIFLHSWNKVNITLSTHDKGGVTEKDFQLAKKINELL
ncbi:MAG: 4a-hydroxytetrahydrobiopterin dehydratase [Ignavibacteriaceae bacterium]|jgi:4a-hydroxytetrahydrobiopterin dehydratase